MTLICCFANAKNEDFKMLMPEVVVSNIFLCSPLLGEMIQLDEHIFQMGWFNHHLDSDVRPI